MVSVALTWRDTGEPTVTDWLACGAIVMVPDTSQVKDTVDDVDPAAVMVTW